MAKPRKSTLDAFIDQFCEFDLESQDRALELMQFENRRARIRAKKSGSAESKTAPVSLVTLQAGLVEGSHTTGAVQQINSVLPFDPAEPKTAQSIP